MRSKQKIALDSNEYIFAAFQRHFSTRLVNSLNTLSEEYDIFISLQIVEEIERNISVDAAIIIKEILEKSNVRLIKKHPAKELIEKYKKEGLKKGDAIIAAFLEEENIDLFISENRHFLNELKQSKFSCLSAEEFIWQLIKNNR